MGVAADAVWAASHARSDIAREAALAALQGAHLSVTALWEAGMALLHSGQLSALATASLADHLLAEQTELLCEAAISHWLDALFSRLCHSGELPAPAATGPRHKWQ